MLSLLECQAADPGNNALHFVYLPYTTLLLYSTGRSILVYDARTLIFVRVLALWEVFPALRNRQDDVKSISVDRGMKLVAAATGNCIAVWSVSMAPLSSKLVWRIHSSLVLPEDTPVTALDSKSGLLVVGSTDSLSVYTLILENDLPTWSPKWVSVVPTPTLTRLAPSLMYIASTSLEDNNRSVTTYSFTSGATVQCVPHPRPIIDIMWRFSQLNSRDDLVLFTITSDYAVRIFLPILDSPNYLQLHASLDLCGTIPSGLSSASHKQRIFCLNREAVFTALSQALNGVESKGNSHLQEGQVQRVRDMNQEAWDLFAKVEENGEIAIQAISNVDRRPPTLLTQMTLQRTLPETLPVAPTLLYFVSPFDATPTHAPNSLTPFTNNEPKADNLILLTSPPITSYSLSPFEFFDAQKSGLVPVAHLPNSSVRRSSEISRLVRTPEGHGLGVYWRHGGGEVFSYCDKRQDQSQSRLTKMGEWRSQLNHEDIVAVLDEGRLLAVYHTATSTLSVLQTASFSTESMHPQSPLTLPSLSSLFSLPLPHTQPKAFTRERECLIGITEGMEVVLIRVSPNTLTFSAQNKLKATLERIIPVDPMAWADAPQGPAHDLLLSVDSEGELAYWTLGDPDNGGIDSVWKRTGFVRTGRKGIRMIKCSSAKKTVLVVPSEQNQEEITIWDSHESQFASGMEYRKIYDSSDPVIDLDWSSTPDGQSILALGFSHHVDLLCEQRMTYFDDSQGWAVCCRVEMADYTPYPISDSLWLSHGSLLIAAGHELFLYGQAKQDSSNCIVIAPSRRGGEETLFEHVARSNGSLHQYHPQMLLQCLLWGKIELVKEIVVNLTYYVEKSRGREIQWQDLPVERFYDDEMSRPNLVVNKVPKQQYSRLFNGTVIHEDEEQRFSERLVSGLVDFLESKALPHLSPNEQAHLLVLIQTTLEIDEQRRALDANGLRYMISMRSFYILNHRTSSSSSPSVAVGGAGGVPRRTGHRERLRYRDMIWAFFSESQQLLLDQCSAACNGKMTWSDAKALGISIWLDSVDVLKSQMENIARNEYMTGDARDPVACSLFYFALGKVKLVHGLWRSAASHREQAQTLKFLSNNFSDPRWKTAALKNAYALLSKRRFEYAAAFFLLGSSLKDAINVCIKQLGDFQLAVALARVVEQSNEGPILLEIVRNTVLPIAFKDGNRWLGCWAFWVLHRRDLAVRILLTPLRDIVNSLDIRVDEVVESTYDDPSLALLFSQLKSKTLQAAKGTSEISGRTEFNFVLQIARVFCRMGCHALALDLVRTWSFERPSTVVSMETSAPASPTIPKRPSMFAMHSRHRSSMVIDMDITSLPATGHATPEPTTRVPPTVPEEAKEEGDLMARKAGIGNLMKTAKTHVQVPEFDMSAFF